MKPTKEEYLLYVGNAFPHKNIQFLIKSFSKISKLKPKWRLVLVGKIDSFYRSLQKTAQELGLENKIIFSGRVSDRDLKELYQNALMYVFPSLCEGFGLPGLEAMQNNLPVVSSDASCLPEIYGNAALYFNPCNSEEMIKAILELDQNKKLREEMIKKGSQRIKNFSWQKCAQETLKLYQEVLQK
ncbi:glycosyltransferase family 4 protein [Patescibacteria group bacterium]|nr:glycosyltransferase family 4 protein [Patescibacteria group bacterium]